MAALLSDLLLQSLAMRQHLMSGFPEPVKAKGGGEAHPLTAVPGEFTEMISEIATCCNELAGSGLLCKTDSIEQFDRRREGNIIQWSPPEEETPTTQRRSRRGM